MTNAETNTAATVAEQGTHVAPEKASSKKQASQRKGGAKGQKAAKGGKAKATRKNEAKAGKKSAKRQAAKAPAPRADSKGAKILAMIERGWERRECRTHPERTRRISNSRRGQCGRARRALEYRVIRVSLSSRRIYVGVGRA